MDCQKINERNDQIEQKVFNLTHNVCPVDHQHKVISEKTVKTHIYIHGYFGPIQYA